MIYQQAIDILTSQGKFYINLGLERVQKILDLLNEQSCRAGKPDLLQRLKFIHVAGTNGKGSVCSMLSAILKERGKRKEEREEISTVQPFELLTEKPALLPSCPPALRIGLFTSPHVFDYTERIKINDVQIDKEVFARKLIEIIELAEKNNIHLTEFEILTVVAFDYFAQNEVDIVILETGLGGRLDATNVIEKNICSIITHIDLDHTERLGDTIDKIAYEKAGIIKENCPVIISDKNAGFEVIKQVAAEKNSSLIHAADGHCEKEHSSDAAIQKTCSLGLLRRFTPRNDEMALKGTYQQENLALVLKAIELLNQKGFDISQECIEKGLQKVVHPCRFEYLKEQNILIDGAHNPNGTKVLRESLNHYFAGQKVKFIFGCLKNKDYTQMMKNLFTSKDEIYFYHFDSENACSVEELQNACEFNSKSFDEFKKEDNTLNVVCGSFYMIKELLTKMGIK